jgi:hypothetical protein
VAKLFQGWSVGVNCEFFAVIIIQFVLSPLAVPANFH